MESPSLKDYPRCDEEVRKLADEVWGDIDGKTVTEHAFGAGRVVWGPSVGEVLKSMNIGPDVEIVRRDGGNPIEWIHRRSGEADIYFLSNQQNIIDHGVSLEIWERRYDSLAVNELEKDAARLDVAFRVAGQAARTVGRGQRHAARFARVPRGKRPDDRAAFAAALGQLFCRLPPCPVGASRNPPAAKTSPS